MPVLKRQCRNQRTVLGLSLQCSPWRTYPLTRIYFHKIKGPGSPGPSFLNAEKFIQCSIFNYVKIKRFEHAGDCRIYAHIMLGKAYMHISDYIKLL